MAPFAQTCYRETMPEQLEGKGRVTDELRAARRRIAELEAALASRDAAMVATRKSEERYRILFDKIDLLAFLVDDQGIILLANERGAAFFGASPDALIGRSMLELRSERAEPVAQHRDGQ